MCNDVPQDVPSGFQKPVIPASELSYERALREFFIPNIPFIATGITETWPAQRDWITVSSNPSAAAGRKFFKEKDDNVAGMAHDDDAESHARTREQGDRAPNWSHLLEKYGEFQVSVLQCPVPTTSKAEGQAQNPPSRPGVRVKDEDEEDEAYGHGEMLEMQFKDVVELWMNGKGKGMYIKDWHLRREVRERSKARLKGSKDAALKQPKGSEGLSGDSATDSSQLAASDVEKQSPNLHTSQAWKQADVTSPEGKRDNANETNGAQGEESFYTTPDIFKNDWMDNYYSNTTDGDFSFVYFGTEGTFTPLHRDVYTSYSWSANVLGRKSWYFIPPSSIPFCRVYPSNPSSPLHADIRPGKVNTSKYPQFKRAQVLHVVQEEGSVIYVPSNWYHCVENESPFVISINQNWGNELNLVRMWESMKHAVKETKEALSDVKEVLQRRAKMDPGTVDVEREWDEAVQSVLQQNVGWGWETFYDMIRYNLLNAPAPPNLTPPTALLKNALSVIFEHREEETQSRTRASSYDGALEAALAILDA